MSILYRLLGERLYTQGDMDQLMSALAAAQGELVAQRTQYKQLNAMLLDAERQRDALEADHERLVTEAAQWRLLAEAAEAALAQARARYDALANSAAVIAHSEIVGFVPLDGTVTGQHPAPAPEPLPFCRECQAQGR